ncbi:pilin [Acinetobacter baumannii]|uniref:Pilin n=3 Tax=Acinetobacter baumannii TaxID=470 RepID=A0A1S2G759_ACIBA|nr:pilin [Acinetobacter baumannii]EKP52007.1 putative fimbrial protein [Acinetobacter baumannii Naval-82]ENV27578.1 hypothetical protein F962_00325 [Acinetobacter baumannii NIPH 190]EXC09513.1 fimbrial protein [Acinetobacter baumannii 625974]KQF66451.1 pilus assembly protein PilA [Acinetobacter baumannii]MBD0442260.1 prepilin-type N-terminal cleavage/methylation domain-containing protein [Acinetobacter baumannii]
MNAQKGFTLIELMIVVAIIGILAAIAIPAYQNYIAKSKASAALADIASLKTGYETWYSENGETGLNLAAVGGQTPTGNCSTVAVNPPAAGAPSATTDAIKCTINAPGRLASTAGTAVSIQFDRSATGLFSCTTTNMVADFKPKGCV